MRTPEGIDAASGRRALGQGLRRAALLEVVYAGLVWAVGAVAWFYPANLATHLSGWDARCELNVMQWDVHCFQEGKSWAELWQLPMLYPEENMLANSDHMLGGAVLYWPFEFLTGNPVLAFNLWILLVLALDFTVAYVVARRLLGSRAGALLAAVLFTFGFFRILNNQHAHLLPQFATPLLFLAAVRIAEGKGWRWPVVGGLALAAQFWLGMYLGYMAVIMLGTIFLTLPLAAPRRFLEARFWGQLGLGGLVAASALLPLALPYGRAAKRWRGWDWNFLLSHYMPSWKHFLAAYTPGDWEKAIGMGGVVLTLILGGTALLLWNRWKHGQTPPFWLAVCPVLVLSLACLIVNQFRSYHALYRVLPGFKGLRCPGRLILLAYWPAGLLAGWFLARLMRRALARAADWAPLLGFGVVCVVFLENCGTRSWMPCWAPGTLDQADFYERILGRLPPGAYTEIPYAPSPFAIAGACAAGWRPTLTVYTGKLPDWWLPFAALIDSVRTPAAAAELLGEIRLRGIRFILFHLDQMKPARLAHWLDAQTSTGQPWGRVVHRDRRNCILDMGDTPPEIELLGAIQPREDQSAQGEIDCRPITLKGQDLCLSPCMPLRPGRYRATFDLQADETGAAGLCEVHLGLSAPAGKQIIARPVLLGAREFRPVTQSFVVPDQPGPEAWLVLRVVQTSPGTLRVRSIRITPVR